MLLNEDNNMKLISKVIISVKKKMIPNLISELYKNECDVQNINLIEERKSDELFSIEIIYYNRNSFSSFIDTVKNSQRKYRIESMENLLEEEILGGLLNLSGKMSFENINDYEMGLLGATDLIHGKIDGGNGEKYTGISRNVGLISSISQDEEAGNTALLSAYSDAERDSVIINRFTGLNAYPSIIKFSQEEDLVKTIERVKDTFSLIRLQKFKNADLFMLENFIEGTEIPVCSIDLDDYPLYLLAVTIRILVKNRRNLGDMTFGFIGLELCSYRLARLLLKAGGSKILGFDNNEKAMFALENQGGLATTIDNILSNADVVVFFKNDFNKEDCEKIRPGQFIISLLEDEEIDMDTIERRGVREFIQADFSETAIIFPGIISGLLKSGVSMLSDKMIIDIATLLVKQITNDYVFPHIFSSIHDDISEFIVASQPGENRGSLSVTKKN